MATTETPPDLVVEAQGIPKYPREPIVWFLLDEAKMDILEVVWEEKTYLYLSTDL